MIARDREWLKAAIAEALSWDLFVVEGVVDAIDAAGPSSPLSIIIFTLLSKNKLVP